MAYGDSHKRVSQGGAGEEAWRVTTSWVLNLVTAVIGAGDSLSAAADLTGKGQVVGLITDAAWDAAPITFQVSADGTSYFNLRYNGSEFAESNPGASAYVALDPVPFTGALKIKVRSGTSGSAVAQADATTVTLVCRPVA